MRIIATTLPSLAACSIVPLLQVQTKFFLAVKVLPSCGRKPPEAAAGERDQTIRRPRVGMAGFVAVLLVLALGHRWSVTASWFTSDKKCRERHATPWFVERLDMDCDRLLRVRLWKLYDEGHLFGRLRGGRGGAVEYIMKQLEHPDE
jgi:hypothetical protein